MYSSAFTFSDGYDIRTTWQKGDTATSLFALTNLSDMIGPALTELKSLVTSIHDMYFAENVVNYIAINIYYNSR